MAVKVETGGEAEWVLAEVEVAEVVGVGVGEGGEEAEPGAGFFLVVGAEELALTALVELELQTRLVKVKINNHYNQEASENSRKF